MVNYLSKAVNDLTGPILEGMSNIRDKYSGHIRPHSDAAYKKEVSIIKHMAVMNADF